MASSRKQPRRGRMPWTERVAQTYQATLEQWLMREAKRWVDELLRRYDSIADLRFRLRTAEIERTFSGALLELSERTNGAVARSLKLQGIPDRYVLDPKKIQRFRAENVQLIQSLARDELGRFESMAAEGREKGWSRDRLFQEIEERFDVTSSKARLLGRDQTLKLAADINHERQEAAGVTQYVWRSTKDSLTRGNPDGFNPKGLHWQLDGLTFEWANPPVISLDGRRGHPGEDYQCRCIAEPVIDFLLDTDDE